MAKNVGLSASVRNERFSKCSNLILAMAVSGGSVWGSFATGALSLRMLRTKLVLNGRDLFFNGRDCHVMNGDHEFADRMWRSKDVCVIGGRCLSTTCFTTFLK